MRILVAYEPLTEWEFKEFPGIIEQFEKMFYIKKNNNKYFTWVNIYYDISEIEFKTLVLLGEAENSKDGWSLISLFAFDVSLDIIDNLLEIYEFFQKFK